MSTKSACCSRELSWKTPKLSSVPVGMADGLKVTVGCVPGGRMRAETIFRNPGPFRHVRATARAELGPCGYVTPSRQR
jgi:hypothetical protein